MRNYTWYYGLFHWFMHFLLTTLIVWGSGMLIFPIYADYDIFGRVTSVNVVDYIIAFVLTVAIDLDHMTVWRKVGIRRVVDVQKKLTSPIHNFFFLAFFSIMSAMAAIFFSKDAGVLLFVIVAHMLWDIAEDVFMFQVSFRRWERTWGLNKKDLQDTYNELIKLEPIIDPAQEKKQSVLGRIVSRIMNKIRKKAIKA